MLGIFWLLVTWIKGVLTEISEYTDHVGLWVKYMVAWKLPIPKHQTPNTQRQKSICFSQRFYPRPPLKIIWICPPYPWNYATVDGKRRWVFSLLASSSWKVKIALMFVIKVIAKIGCVAIMRIWLMGPHNNSSWPALGYAYLIFVNFLTQPQFELWKSYTWKCVNLQQKLPRDKIV